MLFKHHDALRAFVEKIKKFSKKFPNYKYVPEIEDILHKNVQNALH